MPLPTISATARAAYGLLRIRSRDRSRSFESPRAISALAELPLVTHPSVRRPVLAPS
jgi:hypothetical protein